MSAGGAQTGTTSYDAVPGARFQRSGASLYYVLTDHLGSASVTLDAGGAVVGEQRYYPFGTTRAATGTMGTDRLFTGQRDVGLGGLIHFNARFYSATLGRFVSADPLVPGPGNPQALNRYTYVYNRPLQYIDPSGLSPCEDPSWASAFEQGHGRRPTAGDYADCVFADTHAGSAPGGGWTDADWQVYGLLKGIDPCGAVGNPTICQDLLGNASPADPLHDPLTYLLAGVASYRLAPVAGLAIFEKSAIAYLYLQQLGKDLAVRLFGAACAAVPACRERLVAQLNLTETVAGHMDASSGEPARAYIGSRLLIREIMAGGLPKSDPGGVATALRWDVPGSLGRSQGTWELVVDMKTATILHFVFKSTR